MVALFLAVFVAPATFSGQEITVEVDDGTVWHTQTTWWGLARTKREIRWMQTPDYDFPAWMARDSSGAWYVFLTDEMEYDPR